MNINRPTWEAVDKFVSDTATNKRGAKELLDAIYETRWTDLWETVESVMDGKPKSTLLVLTKAEIRCEDPDEGVVVVENIFVVHEGGKEYTFTINLWNDFNDPEVTGSRSRDDFTPVRTKTQPKGLVLIGEKVIPMKDWDGF